MSISIKKLVGIASMLAFPLLVSGQGFLDPVSFNLEEAPSEVKLNETFDVVFKATIDGKWHLYSAHNDPSKGPFPTNFTPKTDGVTIDSVRETPPEIAYDPNFDTELGWHAKSATFTLPVTLKNLEKGSQTIEIDVQYQVCDDKACLPPKTKTLAFGTEVTGGEASGTIEEAGAETQKSGYGGKGVFSFLWIALTAGFAALLTPCVFPMIPLTVSFFTKQSHGSNRKAFWQAIFFGLAIIGTFTLLGVILSLLIGASGANSFASNPWVNLFIGLVLVVFAVSLLGLFELRLPYSFTNYLNRKSNESSGAIGVLFMGLTISAVSFSCTAPFVGGVLAATTGGEWFYPILGMIGFSAAFASPFVLFAMFPRWLESLPKSGSWMNIVKVLLGFVELAAAFKFISNADLVWQWNLVSRPFTIAAWIVIFFVAGLYLLGVIAIGHDKKPESIGTGRLLLALPVMTFSFYLIPGLMGANLGIWDAWLPPKQATDTSVVAAVRQVTAGSGNMASQGQDPHGEGWYENYDKALAAAKEAKKPLFIDFTGYTCTNCRAMETNVFPLDKIQQRFAKMEKLRLYTDDGVDGPENQKFQFNLTGTVALPTYVILDPHSETIIGQLVGYSKKEIFQDFLQSGISQYQSQASR